MATFQLNTTYTFKTTAPSVLGATLTGMEYQGNVSYPLARSYLDVDAMHRAVYPHLPAGTVRDLTKYIYHLFKNAKAEYQVLADPWIDGSSIEALIDKTATIKVKISSASDADKIRNLLTINGFREFNIDIS